MTDSFVEFVLIVASVLIMHLVVSVIHPPVEPRCITIGSVMKMAGDCQ